MNITEQTLNVHHFGVYPALHFLEIQGVVATESWANASIHACVMFNSHHQC